SYDISSMGLNITSGSVYIGTRYVPPVNNVFLSADESGPVGFAGGYWWNDFDGVWSPTQNAFPGYTAMFIRAVEAGGGGGAPAPPATATATPTGSPSCTPAVFNGVIDTSDPLQTGRIFRDDPESECAAPQTCSPFDIVPYHYDEYTLTNTTGSTQCVTITLDPMTCVGTHYIQSAAYMGSFDPGNICANYLGDIGNSPDFAKSYSVDVPDGQTLVVTVHEACGAGCVGYQLTIDGLCGGGGTPTPTATATATPTGSPTCTPGGGTPGPWLTANPYPTTIV